MIIIRSHFTPFLGGNGNVLNASEDQTIEFGTPKAGIKNYQESHEERWILIVPEGRQVQITFKIFELEQSSNCEKDYLEIREAYFEKPYDPTNLKGDYGAIISKPICGSSLPGPLQSKGNMVWVHFRADSNSTTTYKGFKASFTAGTCDINYMIMIMLYLNLIFNTPFSSISAILDVMTL